MFSSTSASVGNHQVYPIIMKRVKMGFMGYHELVLNIMGLVEDGHSAGLRGF